MLAYGRAEVKLRLLLARLTWGKPRSVDPKIPRGFTIPLTEKRNSFRNDSKSSVRRDLLFISIDMTIYFL